jgi:hypothetical protein
MRIKNDVAWRAQRDEKLGFLREVK